MRAFLFALNAVLPIVLIMALGFVLKKMGLMSVEFSKLVNRVVYHVFLPIMLFLNIYKIQSFDKMNLGYVLYASLAVLVVFALAIPLSRLITNKTERRGALVQSAFRSNYAFIGIPLAQSLFGEDGVVVATLLSAIIVPLFNVLAVISLSIFKEDEGKINVKSIFKNIYKNPLIRAIFLGIFVLVIRFFLTRAGIDFALSDISAVYNPLTQLSNLATPLALLCLGAQFEFSAVSELKREISCGVFLRCVAVPVLCIGFPLVLLSGKFGGAEYAAFVAAFATPVAVSTVPLAQEMKSDSTLAGQLVVWSTLFSAVTVFVASLVLKLVGIF